MAYRRKTWRFHIDTGPEALFDRVRHVMSDVKERDFSTPHVMNQAQARKAPVQDLTKFNSSEWELMTAEVDSHKGRFVNSAWAREVDGNIWWVVIGLRNTILTVIRKQGRGLGREVIRGGQDYEFVRQVNKKLMESERQ